MCIFVASESFSHYAFVLLSNRDEYLDRRTEPAHWWPGTAPKGAPSSEAVYAPRDLSKGGTWMGVRGNRIAILVNYHETPRDTEFSRGSLPLEFLQSDLGPEAWLREFYTAHRAGFDQCGGFTMLFGLLGRPNELYTTTNRAGPPGGGAPLDRFESTLVLSNGSDASWTKLQRARDLVRPLESRSDVLPDLWSVLSTADIGTSADTKDLRRSIFIPNLGTYGTRTQTVVLVGHDGTLDYWERQVEGTESPNGSSNGSQAHMQTRVFDT